MDYIDALYIVKHNPFKYSEYLYCFYKELQNVDNNLLLSELLIPFCNHPKLSQQLKMARKDSTLVTKFKEPEDFFDINEHILHFKELSRSSLHSAILNDLVEIDVEKLNVEVLPTNKHIEEIKEAKNLAKLFSHLKVADIYSHFRIRKYEISYL